MPRTANSKSEADRVRDWKANASPEQLAEYREKVTARKRSYAFTERGRALIAATKKRAYKRASEYINSHKKQCAGCGEETVVCLQFHHRNPEEKDANVIHLANSSRAKVDAELAKCVVLCANCHIKVHENLMECPK